MRRGRGGAAPARPLALLSPFTFFCCLLLAACGAPPAASLPTPLPTVAAQPQPSPIEGGLLLVSVEGVRAVDVQGWLAQEGLTTLSALAARGHLAPLQPVEPTLPDSAAATLLTGQPPAAHGWVDLGAGAPLRPFWAGQTGLHSALVGMWPGGGPALADAGIAPGATVQDHALHEPLLAPAQAWAAAPPSFSPRLEATLPLAGGDGLPDELFLLAVDTLNDGVAAYDEYWVATARRIGPGAARLHGSEAEWATLLLAEGVGVELLLLDGRAAGLRLYQSPARALVAWPAGLAARLQGDPAWPLRYPPDPDVEAYRRGWLSADQLRQMGARQSGWLAEAAARLWEAAPAAQRPVVALRLPAPGLLARALLLVDPAQPGWQQARQRTLLAARQQALADVEAALVDLLSHVDLSRNRLFVVSPLGAEPLRAEVSLPRLLEAAGLEPTDFQVEARGGAAWLRADSPRLAQAATALPQVREPGSGQPLVARVARGEEVGGEWAAGWLLVQARPGYALTAQPGELLVAPTRWLAGTGGAASSPDLAGWWLAVGSSDVAPDGEPLPLEGVAEAVRQALVE